MRIIFAANISFRDCDLMTSFLSHTIPLNTNYSIAHRVRVSPFKISAKHDETMRFAFVKEIKEKHMVLSLTHSNHPISEEDCIMQKV
jgi:hypothetical protein